KERAATEPAAAADEAQGRHCAGECLRRRPRRRADLPLYRAARAREKAGRAPMAAVDDAAIDPRGLRETARRQGDAAARRRGEEPLRGRLAGGYQWHARHDRLQLEGRWLLS